MFHIKDSKDKKTGLNFQNKAASAVPPFSWDHQAVCRSPPRNAAFFTLHKLLIPDIPTAEMVLAMRAPFKTAISKSPWLF